MTSAPSEFEDVWSADRAMQNAAYETLMAATGAPVPWIGLVWDDVVAHLTDKDNHNRAIAAQLLCNLAAHDPGGRILGDLDALISVTWDERFVTARHSLRSLWKIGLGGADQRRAVLRALAKRYRDSMTEKNGTLVRYDIVESLRHLYDVVGDPAIEPLAHELIDAEPDPKYRRKYAKHWK